MKFKELSIGDWFADPGFFNEVDTYAVKINDTTACFFSGLTMRGRVVNYIPTAEVNYVAEIEYLIPLSVDMYQFVFNEAKISDEHYLNIEDLLDGEVICAKTQISEPYFVKSFFNDTCNLVCFYDEKNPASVGRVISSDFFYNKVLQYTQTKIYKGFKIEEVEIL